MIWDSYIRQNPETPSRTIDGEAVVIAPRDAVLHTLNDTATFIWEHADGTRTLAQIAALLHADFDVDDEELQRDAIAFVQDAQARGLLLLSPTPIGA